jgi:predicted RNA binding protein YcfA (HicA-like mRNA interferase family)
MKYRDIIKMIEADGWYWTRTTGSHRIYHHPTKKNIVIISAHNLGHDVKKGILSAILKEAGLK